MAKGEKMKKTRVLLLLIFTAFAVVPSQAGAIVLTFSDRTSFLSATGAINATGPLPNLGAIPGGSQTVGSLTFTTASGSLFIGSLGVGGIAPDPWTPRLPGNQIAISGPEHVDVDVAGPVYSMGFDFVEPEADIVSDFLRSGGVITDSTFMVTLINSGIFVDSFSFNAPNDIASFVGVWADSPFNRIEVRDTASIDDEYFGQFYTGMTSLRVTPVPEPTTLLLVGSGLAGMALMRRLRGWIH